MSSIFEEQAQELQKLFKLMPRKAAIIARKHFDKSFQNSGFTNNRLVKWRPVRDRRKGRKGFKEKPLVSSGRLRASIRTKLENNAAVIYTDVPYAEIHNDGKKTSVKAHTRTSKGGKASKVKAHNRVTEKRQFMGNSVVMEKQIEDMITNHVDKVFKI